MQEAALTIERGRELPPIRGRGRKKGSGPNLVLLKKMDIGDSIWDVPFAKMDSIKSTAYKFGMRIMVRRIPETNLYAIKRTK